MTRARELARLGNENVLTADTDNNLGIGSLTPDRKLDVGTGDLIVGTAITLGGSSGIVSVTQLHAGVVTATTLYGDGQYLSGISAAGLGTALDDNSTDGLQVIYYTNSILEVSDDITVDVPNSSSSNIAYTQYAEVSVDDSKTLTVADGDELLPDILGISTAGVQALSGTGGRIRCGEITNKAGNGCPDLVNGVVVSGIATFTDNVSIAGTLTYDDVTNIDSVGLITARSGVKVTGGSVVVGGGVTVGSDLIHLTDNSKINLGIGSDLSMWHNGSHSYIQNTTGTLYVRSKADETAMSINPDGGVDLRYDGTKKIETVGTGISVFGGMKIQSGLMRESVNISSTALNSDKVINLSDGMVHYRSSAVGGANIKLNVISSAGINTDLAIGDAMTVQVMTVAASTSHFVDQIRIDGVEASAGVTTSWVGGSVPTAGGGSGVDTYAFNILKTGNATYVVVANQVTTS